MGLPQSWKSLSKGLSVPEKASSTDRHIQCLDKGFGSGGLSLPSQVRTLSLCLLWPGGNKAQLASTLLPLTHKPLDGISFHQLS